MKIKQFEVWIADLNPPKSTEPGKIRPVVIVQTDLLNAIHPSIIICPVTTNVQPGAETLRVHLTKGMAKLKHDCDVMIDQIRAIDVKRLERKIGSLPGDVHDAIKRNLATIFDL